ncbi:MAG: D-Ala-D-Ala carboxypeptidase family metallohydrolase, partial [Faecousia sp.]
MTVKQKQCLLTYLGYYTGSIDGIWGDMSRQATERFQSDYGLEPDGVFGDATANRIREVIASGEQPVQQPESAPEMVDVPGWWKDIKYFTRAEFRCPCPRCGGFPAEPSEKLVRLAERVREHFGVPVTVTSGVRCQPHNDELPGSVPNSYHVRGKAMDFCVRGFSASTVLP